VLLIAGGEEALLHAVEGAEDQIEHAHEEIARHGVAADDVLIAAAASGTTPFTLACLRSAKAAGALTVGIANNPGTPLLTESDHPILLDSGPEPIAGSTRMKAGTAQRIAMNLLSSVLMIRMGRVYEGLMVDVQASNKKLEKRSEAMLRHLTGRSGEEARMALANAEGSVKLAVLLLYGCRPEEAKALLDRNGGRLRSALGELRVSRMTPE
jgi:N-acetylmuramic acid 6-phosphate etherase